MATLSLNGLAPAESFVSAYRGPDLIKRGFRWKTPPAIILGADSYPVFNLTSDSINNVAFRAMNDDAPPYLVNGAHLGGNHAIVGGRISHVGHGKTNADIGSVWAKGGEQFVLIRTLGVNQVLLAQIGSDVVPTAGTFTHVSGATNTANIVASTAVQQNFYPMIANYCIKAFVDGQEVASDSGTWAYQHHASFLESYDVMAREDVLAWFVSNGSAGGMNVTGTPLFSVVNSYEFDQDANLTIYSDFLARSSATLNAVYGVQMQHAGATQFYVPKSTPFTHDGVTKNYALLQTATPTTTDVLFNGVNTEATGLYLDRFLSLNANYALAAGFVPVQDEEPVSRRALVSGTGLKIAASGKAYMRAVDQGGHSVTAGNNYKFVSYRNIVLRNSARTASYVVRTKEADFLYADWHDAAKIDRLPVPADLIGRSFSVVEKSANVSLMSESLNGSLMVNVSAAGSYGYLVLRIAP